MRNTVLRTSCSTSPVPRPLAMDTEAAPGRRGLPAAKGPEAAAVLNAEGRVPRFLSGLWFGGTVPNR